MSWQNDPVYKTLERIITNAGTKIRYGIVPDDAIDGAIWARSDIDSRLIHMPNDESAFNDTETACLILGHEMGHILSRVNSPDEPAERMKNEAVCDLIGYYLFKLAELTYEKQIEDAFRNTV